MMSIIAVFLMYVFLFAIIGWMRGWAKELLVSFSVILALGLSHLIRQYIPPARTMAETDITLFWIRIIILMTLVYFGYQTVVSIPHLAAKARREKFQDSFLGMLLGGANGYLVAGTVLFYIHAAGYPFPGIISPHPDPAIMQRVNQMMLYAPPQLLGDPGIYFAIILAFVFVLVVYI